MRNEDTVTLTLTPNEALVLFEFLSRYTDDGTLSIVDQAEQRVLWDLLAGLEPQMTQTINNPNYDSDVAAARAAVRDALD